MPGGKSHRLSDPAKFAGYVGDAAAPTSILISNHGLHVEIVVNRVGLDSGQISLKKAQETLNRNIYWQVPNDYASIVQFRNNGIPLNQLAPKALVTQSLQGLANRLAGIEPEDEARRSGFKGNWLGFLKQKQA